jgi:hypothetical protein
MGRKVMEKKINPFSSPILPISYGDIPSGHQASHKI